MGVCGDHMYFHFDGETSQECLNDGYSRTSGMKRFLLPFITISLSTAGLFIMSYASGRAGTSIGLFLVVPYLLNLLCLLALLILLLIAIAKRKHIRTALKAFVLSTTIVALGIVIPPEKVFLLGFRHRIQATISANELRQIAQEFEKNLPPKGFLPGPGKRSLWTAEEHAPFWTSMTNSTSLGKLDNWVVIYQHRDDVELSWGGALAGHWGVRIKTEATTSEGDIAPGISTFGSD